MSERITITAGDFRTVFKRSLLFAAPENDDEALPVLQSVRVEFSPHWLIGIGADGTTLGIQKVPCDASGSGAFTIASTDVRSVLRALPRAKKPKDIFEGLDDEIAIDFQDARGDIPPTLSFVYREGASVGSFACEGIASVYPDVRKLLAAPGEGDPPDSPEVFAMDPEFTMRVAKAAKATKHMVPGMVRWYADGPNRPVLARWANAWEGDEFAALLMPIWTEWQGHEREGVPDRVFNLSAMPIARPKAQTLL